MKQEAKSNEQLKEELVEMRQRATRAENELAALQEQLETKQQQTAETLQDHIAFEKLIRAISTHLINLPTAEIDDGLNHSLALIGEFAGADRCYILLYQHDKLTGLHQWCANGVESPDPSLLSAPLAHFPWLADKLRRLESIHIPGTGDLPQAAEATKERMQTLNMKSVLAIPMVYQESLVGLLLLDSVKRERSWSDRTISLLALVAEIVANALERKSVEQREKLAYEVGAQLGTLIDISELLSYTVKQLRDTFGYYHAQVYLSNKLHTAVDDDVVGKERLVMQAGTGKVGKELREKGHALSLTAKRSLVAQAGRQRQVIVANDVLQDPHYLPNPLLPDTRSEVAIPLVVGQRLVGVLDVQNTSPNHFDAEEIRVLRIIANQLLIALARSELFNKNQELLEELTVLHTVATLAAEAEDENTLIEQVTEVIGKAIPADEFGFRFLNPTSGNLRSHASYRGKNDRPPSTRITGPGEGITGHVATTGQPWRVADVTREPAYIVSHPTIRSELCVPLKIGERVIGVINIESTRPDAFTEADERLLMTMAGQVATAIEKLRLFDETRRRAEEKAALLATTKAISSLQLDDVLNTIVHEVKNLLQAHSSRIHLRKPGDTSLHCVIDLSESSEARRQFPLQVGEGITGSVALSGIPEIIKNSLADRRKIQVPGTSTEPESLALAPLKIRQHILGVMTVTRQGTNHPFTETDLTLLTAFADQAAVAIDNARLFSAERQQLEEFAVLHAVATAAAEATTESELLEHVTQLIGDTLMPDNFGVLLLDEIDNSVLRTHPSYRGEKTTVPLDQGVTGRVFTSGRPMRLSDLSQEAADSSIHPGTRSQLCTPLRIGNRIIGVISVESKKVGAFSQTDERLLTTVTSQLATGIERIRMFEAERRRARQQRTLAETAAAILAAQNETELWPAVTTAVQNILAAERTAVYLYDAATDTLDNLYALGFSPQFTRALADRFRDVPLGQVLRELEPTAVDDVLTDERTETLRELMEAEAFRTYAVFPLTTPARSLGALAAYRNERKPFTADDLSAGQTLAGIVAVALQNVQRLLETNHALFREQRLNKVTRILNKALDLPTILANVVRMATEIVEAEMGSLGLVIDSQIMTFYPYNLPQRINLRPVSRGNGLTWHIMQTGQAVHISNYQEHAQAEDKWIRAGVKAYIGVPLTAEGNSLGVLELFRLTPRKPFNARDLALAESIGRQAGIAIHNARLYAEAQQRAAALATALAKQEELDRSKNLFIENVSHELRTPLGIIYGHAELIESGGLGELEPSQKQSIQVIARRARMLTNLIEDLSTLLAAETQEFRRETIDAAQLMYSMLADYQMKAEEAGITLTAKIEEDLPTLMGDSVHLRRVFDNLVSNAFKATPAGGSVKMHMWAEGTDVVIEVADTGVGIPEDQLRRVFERFYRVEGKSKRQKGTGLGLALVKEIVAAHRGQVSVESQVNEGTTFRIVLPGYDVAP